MGQVIGINGNGRHSNQQDLLNREQLTGFVAMMQQIIPQLGGQTADLRLSLDALSVMLVRRLWPEQEPDSLFRELHGIKGEIVAASCIFDALSAIGRAIADAEKREEIENKWTDRITTP